jgi:hypothetical protein
VAQVMGKRRTRAFRDFACQKLEEKGLYVMWFCSIFSTYLISTWSLHGGYDLLGDGFSFLNRQVFINLGDYVYPVAVACFAVPIACINTEPRQ